MQKKHLIAYPLTALLAFGAGSAGSGASTTSAGAAAPTATTTVTVPASTDDRPAETVTAPAQTVTVTREAEPAATTEAAATVPGDGTYEVGVDIQPGKYSSDVPASGNCYWARMKNDDPFDGILANNNSSGKSVVVIKKSDKYFQSSGCSDWTKR